MELSRKTRPIQSIRTGVQVGYVSQNRFREPVKERYVIKERRGDEMTEKWTRPATGLVESRKGSGLEPRFRRAFRWFRRRRRRPSPQ